MNYTETMEYINSFTKSGKPVKDLSRIRKLLNLLGNPQGYLKFIHVAGTNGKGSTVEMLSNALKFANYTVGTFTSPYMYCYEDRIRINGENIPQDRLCKYAEIVKSAVDSHEYSQFEITMAIALLHYKSEHCDIVVLETGIGGAVDSTNIVENTVVSVITSISLDHTAILGDTLAKIATQKVGIVKPNRPVVLSNDNVSPEVVSIVEDYAKRMHSELYVPELANVVDMSIQGETFTYGDETYHLKMLGKHQVANASTVIETCKLLNSMCYDIPMECVKASLERTQVPFRMEVLDMGVKVIVDGSHNVGGVTSLIDTLKTCGIDKVTLLTGMISTKDYSSCCKLLDGIADKVICTDGYIYNAVPSDELAKLFTCEVIQVPLNDALHTGICTAKKDGSVLVMCGSLYLLSHLCA